MSRGMTTPDTTIRVGRDTWERLNKRKRTGDTFDDVLNRVLDQLEAYEEAETGNLKTPIADLRLSA